MFTYGKCKCQNNTEKHSNRPNKTAVSIAYEYGDLIMILLDFSGCASNCEVFLGGSCNPTTWRTDTAIPELKKHGITFYNPVSSITAHIPVRNVRVVFLTDHNVCTILLRWHVGVFLRDVCIPVSLFFFH